MYNSKTNDSTLQLEFDINIKELHFDVAIMAIYTLQINPALKKAALTSAVSKLRRYRRQSGFESISIAHESA